MQEMGINSPILRLLLTVSAVSCSMASGEWNRVACPAERTDRSAVLCGGKLLGHSSFVTTMVYLHVRRQHFDRSPNEPRTVARARLLKATINGAKTTATPSHRISTNRKPYGTMPQKNTRSGT